MKNFLLILITCITILFTSCNTNYFDDYEKEETTTIMTRVVQDPLHPIINGENVYGNWIQLFYIHPTQYIGKWNIYLQYQSGAEWKYYNLRGEKRSVSICGQPKKSDFFGSQRVRVYRCGWSGKTKRLHRFTLGLHLSFV